jgi:hypothetical protein
MYLFGCNVQRARGTPMIRSASPRLLLQPSQLWDAVQAQLAGNAAQHNDCGKTRQPSLLAGMLFDGDGNRMTPSHAVNPTTATQAAAPARQSAHRRTTIAKPAGVRRSSPSLNDQVLALAIGKTQQEITAACAARLPTAVR